MIATAMFTWKARTTQEEVTWVTPILLQNVLWKKMCKMDYGLCLNNKINSFQQKQLWLAYILIV